jgi:hypothetical protein
MASLKWNLGQTGVTNVSELPQEFDDSIAVRQSFRPHYFLFFVESFAILSFQAEKRRPSKKMK